MKAEIARFLISTGVRGYGEEAEEWLKGKGKSAMVERWSRLAGLSGLILFLSHMKA